MTIIEVIADCMKQTLATGLPEVSAKDAGDRIPEIMEQAIDRINLIMAKE